MARDIAMKSDVGRVRGNNEDACGFLEDKEGVVLVVCDGMGGVEGGEVASRIARDTILETMRDPSGKVRHAIGLAGERIFNESQARASLRGMGTTATVAAASPSGYMYFGQVGDSRAYVLRAGKLTAVTRDQTPLGAMIDTGQVSEEDAESMGGGGSVLLQALGVTPFVDIGVTSVDLARGDVVLLCSDGLYSGLSKAKLAQLLTLGRDSRSACRALVDAANDAGGHDNITCVVARFGSELPAPRGGVWVQRHGLTRWER